MVPSLLTAANWPIVGQLCWILGKVMNFIYNFLNKCLPSDSGLVGLSIILYTIFVYTLLLPLTIKQQRTSKMSSVMNPEIQTIQKKYKNIFIHILWKTLWIFVDNVWKSYIFLDFPPISCAFYKC